FHHPVSSRDYFRSGFTRFTAAAALVPPDYSGQNEEKDRGAFQQPAAANLCGKPVRPDLVSALSP
ncbi:MAG: hypothetical protein ACI406_16120, partial [Victivallis vadensis]